MCLVHESTIRIRSSITIRSNTNGLFGPLVGTEANIQNIFKLPVILCFTMQTFLTAREIPRLSH